jgi:hypothetical protein
MNDRFGSAVNKIKDKSQKIKVKDHKTARLLIKVLRSLVPAD